MAFSSNRNNRRLSEINITPLVDVMLVLMIIFLVTAPLMKYSVEIALPKTVEKNIKKVEEPVRLFVDKKGDLFWNEELLTKDQFRKKIADFDKNRVLQIAADKESDYQFITYILVEARSNGVNNIGFLLESDK